MELQGYENFAGGSAKGHENVGPSEAEAAFLRWRMGQYSKDMVSQLLGKDPKIPELSSDAPGLAIKLENKASGRQFAAKLCATLNAPSAHKLKQGASKG